MLATLYPALIIKGQDIREIVLCLSIVGVISLRYLNSSLLLKQNVPVLISNFPLAGLASLCSTMALHPSLVPHNAAVPRGIVHQGRNNHCGCSHLRDNPEAPEMLPR